MLLLLISFLTTRGVISLNILACEIHKIKNWRSLIMSNKELEGFYENKSQYEKFSVFPYHQSLIIVGRRPLN